MTNRPEPAVATPAAATLMALHASAEHEQFFTHLDEHWLELWYAFEPIALRTLIELQPPPASLRPGAALLLSLVGAESSAPTVARPPQPDAPLREQVQEIALEAGTLRLAGRSGAALERAESLRTVVRRLTGFVDTTEGVVAMYALQGGTTAILAGDWNTARSYLLRGFTPARPARFPFATRDLAAKMALTEALSGNISEAAHWSQKAKDLPRTESWVETLIDDTVWLTDYCIAVETLDMERAETMRQQQPSPLSHFEFWAPALQIQVHHLTLTGRNASAVQLCDAVAAAGMPLPDSDTWQAAALDQARTLCDARPSPNLSDRDPWALLAHRVQLLRARRFEEAAAPYEGQADTSGDIRPTLALDLVRGEAMLSGGKTAEAGDLLTATFATVVERGVLSLVRYLTHDGLDVVAQTPEGQKVRATMEEYRIPLVPVAPARGTTLTSAERDVLRLLKARRTRQEIADELYLSINTVKSHLASAYRKLGASNRREALAKADHLDL